MEILLGTLVALLLLRLVLGTVRRGILVFLLLFAGLQLLGRLDPHLAPAVGGPLLMLFLVLVGFRLMTRGLTG